MYKHDLLGANVCFTHDPDFINSMYEDELVPYMKSHEPLAVYKRRTSTFIVSHCSCVNGHPFLIGYLKEDANSSMLALLDDLKDATLISSSETFNQMLNCKGCRH